MLGNPVPGPIRPFGTAGSGFGVVAVFGAVDAFHPANNPDGTHGHQGIDIGNGTCGFPILAVEDGTIDEILTAPNGARIVRYQLTKYPGYQAALAHMDTFEVNLGQKVMRSQIIGHAGRSGTSACHLHGGMRLNGKEIDWWPLLDQNSEGDMTPIPAGKFTLLTNKRTVVTAPIANFRAERVTEPDPRSTVLMKYPKDTVVTPLVQADDGTAAGGATPTRWYGAFGVNDAGFAIFGWFHSSVVAGLTDVATDCTPEIAKAISDLKAKIAVL